MGQSGKNKTKMQKAQIENLFIHQRVYVKEQKGIGWIMRLLMWGSIIWTWYYVGTVGRELLSDKERCGRDKWTIFCKFGALENLFYCFKISISTEEQ